MWLWLCLFRLQSHTGPSPPFGVEGAYLLFAPFSVGGFAAVWGPLGPARPTVWVFFQSTFCVTFLRNSVIHHKAFTRNLSKGKPTIGTNPMQNGRKRHRTDPQRSGAPGRPRRAGKPPTLGGRGEGSGENDNPAHLKL